jgi:hypothetical protein
MRYLSLLLLLLCTGSVFAHQVNLSSLMIYEQNGKKLLVIKSSIGAFEGEIDYLYGKEAYKTPEEFQQLVVKYFYKNCVVIMNHDTVKFLNPKVILGHETTVFAELENVPSSIKTVTITNTLFKDMQNNVCELILTLKNLPKKQYLLTADTYNQVNLTVEGNKWKVEKPIVKPEKKPNYLVWLAFSLLSIAGLAFFFVKRKKTTFEVPI